MPRWICINNSCPEFCKKPEYWKDDRGRFCPACREAMREVDESALPVSIWLKCTVWGAGLALLLGAIYVLAVVPQTGKINTPAINHDFTYINLQARQGQDLAATLINKLRLVDKLNLLATDQVAVADSTIRAGYQVALSKQQRAFFEVFSQYVRTITSLKAFQPDVLMKVIDSLTNHSDTLHMEDRQAAILFQEHARDFLKDGSGTISTNRLLADFFKTALPSYVPPLNNTLY